MFETHTFWFIMVGGKPVNVMRMDPHDITYHFYSGPDGGWVGDNRLFDFVHGPSRSRRDATPTTRSEALAFLADTGYRHGIDDRAIRLRPQNRYTVEHYARWLLDAASPDVAPDAPVHRRIELAHGGLGIDDETTRRAQALSDLVDQFVASYHERTNPWAGYLEAPSELIRIYQDHQDDPKDTTFEWREYIAGSIVDALVARSPGLDRRFVQQQELNEAVRGARSTVAGRRDSRPQIDFAAAPAVLAELLRADADLRADLARQLESIERVDVSENPWRFEDGNGIRDVMDMQLHQLIDLSQATDAAVRTVDLVAAALRLVDAAST